MRGRPEIGREEILRIHAELERNYPPGHAGRASRLELVHEYVMTHRELLGAVREKSRVERKLSMWRRKLAKGERLGEMANLAERTGELRPRALARIFLGKSAGDLSADVVRLAREWGALLRQAGVVINVDDRRDG